ncbi:MAG: sulfotransferase [Acidobacteria bacterium]|nr:sulfotransferase [Acidobacteriota bacterium]
MIEPANKTLRLSREAWTSLSRKVDPQKSRLNWKTRLGYGWNGAIHSLLGDIQKRSHAEALQLVQPEPPVFILGFWRSGTTFLHELLCCDPQFGFPSTYACLNPSHFLLSESWTRNQNQRTTQRAMDAMTYSWASPQEDEFALLALGATSPYEALLVPSLMRDAETLLDLRTRSREDQVRWGETLQHFLKLLTLQQKKPLVLKSPSHGFRLPALQGLFPEARYILIERNPYEVFASNLKLWRTLVGQYGWEQWRPEEIENFILRAYVLHEEIVSQQAEQGGAKFMARVRYEDLVADPLQELEKLYVTLEIPAWPAAQERIRPYLAQVAGHKRNRFEISSAQKARVDTAWGEWIAKKQYLWPEQYIRLA